jgi:prepilin signal peptidase PulO-like enzyme (type II secretory pathway)
MIMFLEYGLVLLVGLSVGSFLNCLVWRMYCHKSAVLARSVCISCGRMLHWHELIPLFSFLILKGKCATCTQSIPWYYPVVEVSTAVLFVANFWFVQIYHFSYYRMVYNFILITILIFIFIYDAAYKLVVVPVVMLGIIFGILWAIFFSPEPWVHTVLGAVCGGGFFLIQWLVSKGRWIGVGDIYIGIMIGVWSGWPLVVVSLLIAYIIGAISILPFLVYKQKTLQSEVPLAVFLSVGALAVLFFGHQILTWYLGLVS